MWYPSSLTGDKPILSHGESVGSGRLAANTSIFGARSIDVNELSRTVRKIRRMSTDDASVLEHNARFALFHQNQQMLSENIKELLQMQSVRPYWNLQLDSEHQ